MSPINPAWIIAWIMPFLFIGFGWYSVRNPEKMRDRRREAYEKDPLYKKLNPWSSAVDDPDYVAGIRLIGYAFIVIGIGILGLVCILSYREIVFHTARL